MMSFSLMRLDRGDCSFQIAESMVRRLIAAGPDRPVGLGPRSAAVILEGQPAIALEPLEAKSPLPAPSVYAVIGYDGDLMVALCADRIETVSAAEAKSLPLLSLSEFLPDD